MLWAPLVDTVGNPKLWYGLGAAICGGTILAMSVLPMTRAEFPVLSVLIVPSSIASTFISMSSEIFMATYLAGSDAGRRAAGRKVGNLGGGGIGGGMGLLIAEHVS